MKKIYFAIVLILIALVYCSCTTKSNTPLPLNQGKLMPNWIGYGTNSLGSDWYIYSQVGIDSSAYVVSLKLEFSKEETRKLSPNYSFCPASRINNILIDTMLNRYMDDSYRVSDSLRKKNYNYTYENPTWEHFMPDDLYYEAAPIAEMLYKDQLLQAPIPSNILANWGSGDWIEYDAEDDRIRYFKDDLQETDSSFIYWRYTLYTKISPLMLLSYYYSKKNCHRLTYGFVFKEEYMKGAQKYRYIEQYYVDRFGVPIFEIPCNMDLVEDYTERIDLILKKLHK